MDGGCALSQRIILDEPYLANDSCQKSDAPASSDVHLRTYLIRRGICVCNVIQHSEKTPGIKVGDIIPNTPLRGGVSLRDPSVSG